MKTPTSFSILAFDAIDPTQHDTINTQERDWASFELFRATDKNNDNVIDPDDLQTARSPKTPFCTPTRITTAD